MQDALDEKCTIRGYLYGVVCGDLGVWDRVAGAQVFALPSKQDQPDFEGLGTKAESGKDVARDLDKAKLDELSSGAMQAETDDDGSFCLVDPNYEGGLLDLYACIDRVPMASLDGASLPLDEPECLYLGTVQPLHWADQWYLIATIPSRIWCAVRKNADAWVIVGRVTPCADDRTGLGDLTVTAFDVDLVQHDNLGTATTNPSGVFRIDYPGSRFRKGTWINIEMFGGPDVYFSVVDSDGNPLLEEAPSRGRSAGRADRGPCFCVELCVDVEVPPVGVVPSAWTGIGTHFTIPDGSSLQDFDSDGYAGAPRYAFHKVIRMTGSAPPTTLLGNPVEYRFLVSNVTTPNGSAPPADTDFDRVVGVGPGLGLFHPTKVAQMVRYSPYRLVNIYAQLVDLDADGWFDVNAAIQRTFAAHPTLSPADIPDFEFIDSDGLMALDTAKLTVEADVPASAAGPGDPIPSGDLIGIETKALRFEIREVVNKGASIFNSMPGSGTTLNAMVMNNNAVFRKVAMKEHLDGGNPCQPLSGSKPHVAFTVHHPHIRGANVHIESNDHAYSENITDTPPATSGDAAMPVAGNTSPTVNHLFNDTAGLPGTLHKCTYIVTLSVTPRLHTGDGAAGTSQAQTSFYFEP